MSSRAPSLPAFLLPGRSRMSTRNSGRQKLSQRSPTSSTPATGCARTIAVGALTLAEHEAALHNGPFRAVAVSCLREDRREAELKDV